MSQRPSVRNETRGKIDYQKTATLITIINPHGASNRKRMKGIFLALPLLWHSETTMEKHLAREMATDNFLLPWSD